MERLLRTLFLGLAVAFAIGAMLVAYDLRASDLPPLKARTFWAAVIGSAFFLVGAYRFSTGAKFKLSLLLCAFGVVEILLQALAWMGTLPAVNTKQRLPWARVYWTAEGRGNSIRNRHGWHFPEFNFQNTNRVAVIGDSFVDAVEVRRSRTFSAQLDQQFRAASQPISVFGLGNHGTGPAHYLEVLRYAHHHFHISRAVMVVYLGNDITDSSVQLQSHEPPEFIAYSLRTDNLPVLTTAGEQAAARYRHSIELSHRPVWQFLPRLAASHCMSIQLPLSVRNARATRQRTTQNPGAAAGPDTALARLGLKAAPFAVDRPPEVREAIDIVQGVLSLAAEFARTNGIALHVVTVPFFPPDFYAQSGTNWNARLGNYDFLRLEQEFGNWAATNNVPFLALGNVIRMRALTTSQIQALYLSQGSGHFSEAGHRFAADAIGAHLRDVAHRQ